ncbi:hypothetical protein GGS20DRAFT_243373 [Poronia punctata]|nr:hypothetical protein GGS20DRAFT_243373 [Poronia punctata]
MSKQNTVRRYGKQSKKPARAGRLFVELPQTPIRTAKPVIPEEHSTDDDGLLKLAHDMSSIQIGDENTDPTSPLPHTRRKTRQSIPLDPPKETEPEPQVIQTTVLIPPSIEKDESDVEEDREPRTPRNESKELQVLTWAEVCPPGDDIVKIAEASYAEVYRVTNERGTSIIKVIRMESPIKPQTKMQQKAGLVDEQPHTESDLLGELKISEWVADIPGFVVYKERYIVKGKSCRELLKTHQNFHQKSKREDPDRLQFYPSPSRYLDDTKFLVVELGDAGIALEDFELVTADQLWDIFFHVAIALARAEAKIGFEHRDLHEGNLCVRKVGEPVPRENRHRTGHFGFSGLEITILDYGLSRAQAELDSEPIAYDLERDLSLFTSDHAPQCRVYRQMRSFLLRGDRVCLPPESHDKPYADGIDGTISWAVHEPYTNLLWLAYIYQWMVENFRGPKKEVNTFKRTTKELWRYLNPEAEANVPGFESASDILLYAVMSGWLEQEQLIDERDEAERSILSILNTADDQDADDSCLRRSRRKRLSVVV